MNIELKMDIGDIKELEEELQVHYDKYSEEPIGTVDMEAHYQAKEPVADPSFGAGIFGPSVRAISDLVSNKRKHEPSGLRALYFLLHLHIPYLNFCSCSFCCTEEESKRALRRVCETTHR